MPGQLQESVTSHRLALMMGNSGTAAGTHSHRQSLVPGQLPKKTVSSSHPRSPKGTKRSASTWSISQMSPEVGLHKNLHLCFYLIVFNHCCPRLELSNITLQFKALIV